MSERAPARAVFFEGPGRVSVKRVDLAAAPEPGVVRVESRLVGISHGTEMLAYRGTLPKVATADATLSGLSCPMAYPLKYGYINVGLTAGGERVFAFYPHQDLFDVPTAETVALPADLEWDDAVFLASMETAVSVCHDAAPLPGETVQVVLEP